MIPTTAMTAGGYGLGGILGGALGTVFDAPRQAAVRGVGAGLNALGISDADLSSGDATDFWRHALGQDDSMLASGLGTISNFALDPWTYSGAIGGALLGHGAEKAAQSYNALNDALATNRLAGAQRLDRALAGAHINPTMGIGQGLGEGRLIGANQGMMGYGAREFEDIDKALSTVKGVPPARMARLLPPAETRIPGTYDQLIEEATNLGVPPFQAGDPFYGTGNIPGKMQELQRRMQYAKDPGISTFDMQLPGAPRTMLDTGNIMRRIPAEAKPRTMLGMSPETMMIPPEQIARQPSSALAKMLGNVGEPLGPDMVLPPELMALVGQRGGKTIAKSRSALADALLPPELR